MALIHYLYVGRFVPPEGPIRFRDQRPVCLEPLDRVTLNRLAAGWGGGAIDPSAPPVEWQLYVGTDHLLCDRYLSPPDALRFVATYATATNAQIMDLGSLDIIEPDTLVREATGRS